MYDFHAPVHDPDHITTSLRAWYGNYVSSGATSPKKNNVRKKPTLRRNHFFLSRHHNEYLKKTYKEKNTDRAAQLND